ncbi:MAG: FG-GAP-like repeat-containing protein [Leptolyngbyaceae cyanobacterium HOT.MB2.61]|nr:FG-GAP-like repeat-containing protein [Leptolyngbyaceae cyanobacterium HOT.MB2.61]
MEFAYSTNQCSLPLPTELPSCPHPSPFTSLLPCRSSLPGIDPTVNDPQNPTTGTAPGAIDTAANSGTGTTSNNGTIPLVSITPNVVQNERNNGVTPYTFTVTLSNPGSQAIAINYATADGTATVADQDYIAATGTLTFAPGETSKTIIVNVNGDTLYEANETFQVNLTGTAAGSGPVNFGSTSSTATIINDETPPSFSINNVSHSEGTRTNKLYTFTVTLSSAVGLPVSVNFATVDGTATTADNDYILTNGTLTFNPGETSKTINVTIVGDRKLENTETFFVHLSGATGNITIANGVGRGIIADDDGNGPDFDHDGSADFFWRNAATSENVIWLMDGPTLASVSNLPLAFTDWRVEGMADFNDDGVTDILWHNSQTLETSLWLLNGSSFGTFTSFGPVASSWHVEAIADFNGDNWVDIFWRDRGTGENSIWLMKGASFSSFSFLPAVAPVWTVAATGDFNGDNDLDIFWRNTATGENVIWQLNNAAFGSFTNLVSTSPALQVKNAVDFNNDGNLDILWRNTVTGENTIWLMNGVNLQSFTNLAMIPPNWRLELTANFNNDDKVDLFWRNTVTGENVLWLMDGTTVSTIVSLPTNDPAWQIQ